MKENLLFHLAKFVLRGVWLNRNNSRQGCNLEELINQSDLAHDLVSNAWSQEHI
jgi:hypothetical protein